MTMMMMSRRLRPAIMSCIIIVSNYMHVYRVNIKKKNRKVKNE